MANLFLVNLQGVFTAAAHQVSERTTDLCYPLVTFAQIQGSLILLILGTGWLLTAKRKAKELKFRRYLQTSDSTQRSRDSDKKWPGVTIILPLKGCRDSSLRNWESQLYQEYGGDLEILFIVDGKNDPAFKAATNLAKTFEDRDARVIVAGQSKSNSQKIHNIQTGIRAASSRSDYVLCVDDDVYLHPATLHDIVSSMRDMPKCFMATGYPFDMPVSGSNVLTYAALSYHLPLLIAFSLQEETHFVWGGFMLVPLHEMLHDQYDIMKAWADGGYSDDLIIAAKCGEHRLPVLCPSFAIFPQRLETQFGWRQYWNYLRRQVYVMDTYSTPLNRRINHAMMCLHSYLSLAFTVPATTGVIVQLFQILSPSLKLYDVGFNWMKLWLGFYLNNVFIPPCMLYTYLTSSIVWSGVEYSRRHGKVYKVRRAS